jgi:hypothetical protein
MAGELFKGLGLIKVIAELNKKMVSEIDGVDLDYWVARAEGYKDERPQDGQMIKGHHRILIGPQKEDSQAKNNEYSPSTNWQQAGPIIERERIMLDPVDNRMWNACYIRGIRVYSDKSPLVAAMRAFVAESIGNANGYVGADE